MCSSGFETQNFKQLINYDSRTKELIETKVTNDVPPAFRLTLPIFKGGDPVTFYVEFGFEYTDSGVRLFIFSDEIEALIYTERVSIIEKAVKPMRDAGIPIIWNG